MKDNKYFNEMWGIDIWKAIIAILVILVTGWVLSYIYVITLIYGTSVLFSVWILGIYGFAMWEVFKYSLYYWKVRNKYLAYSLIIILTAILIYFQWITWLTYLVSTDFEQLSHFSFPSSLFPYPMEYTIYNLKWFITSPLFMLKTIGIFNGTWVWGIFWTTFTWAWLWVVWLLEIYIQYTMIFDKARSLSSIPYCEKSKKWAKEQELLTNYQYIKSKKDVVWDLEEWEIKKVILLQWENDEENKYARITLYECEWGDNYISIHNKKRKTNSKGENEISSSIIIQNLIIDDTTKKWLLKNNKVDEERLAKILEDLFEEMEKKKK